MKLDALDHPKTLDLAARLGIELPAVIGHLELLWAFTGKKAPQGNIGKWPDGAIARACYWMGSPEVFITALRDAGFVDAHKAHRFVIHDWQEHAPRWVKSKLKTLGLAFVEDAPPDVSRDTSPDVSPDSKGREVKGSEGKRSVTAAERPDESPEFSDFKAIYPPREGGNPWPKALKAINARLREGFTWPEILDGTRRYAAFIHATGKERTEYVLQASTFCGTDKRFTEPWTLPRSRAQVRQDENVDAGLEWLRKSENDNAVQ